MRRTSTRKLYKALSIVPKSDHPYREARCPVCGQTILVTLFFIDHADVKFRGETYTVFIVVDGATTFVTAFAPRAKDSHEIVQCLMELMDTVHCIPQYFC